MDDGQDSNERGGNGDARSFESSPHPDSLPPREKACAPPERKAPGYRSPQPDKERLVLILTRVSAILYLSRVAVAPITSTLRAERQSAIKRYGLPFAVTQKSAPRETASKNWATGQTSIPSSVRSGAEPV